MKNISKINGTNDNNFDIYLTNGDIVRVGFGGRYMSYVGKNFDTTLICGEVTEAVRNNGRLEIYTNGVFNEVETKRQIKDMVEYANIYE